MTNINKFYAISFSSFLFLLLLSGFSCSLPEQATTAQTDNSIVQAKQTDNNDFEFIKIIGDPCRFRTPEGYPTFPSKEIYELQNAGYPKLVSVEEAVAVFNKFAQCNPIGRIQPPLSADEIIAAMALWNCEEDIADFGSKPMDKKVCSEFNDILKTKKLPKGSWIESDGRTCENCSGYEAKFWKISLYVKLDKHRRDLKGEPIYAHLIRLNYISATPANSK